MQQFKTYPGIPPSGVVEPPSVLRIPPLPRPPCPPFALRPPSLPLSLSAGVLLHLTGNFGRIKWYYGRARSRVLADISVRRSYTYHEITHHAYRGFR